MDKLQKDPFRLLGTILANEYRLEQFAGAGGMGAVYRSFSEERGSVAIKILKPDILLRNPYLAELFQREVSAAKRLRHPHIVSVIDSGISADDLHFMVMEWLDGYTLADYLEKGELSISSITDLFRQICKALEYAHRQKIIHLDVKPGNVFLLGEARPISFAKVIDFGMARVLSSESGTTVTRFLGTHQYCAPEQFGGRVSNRSDVYSLGVTLYQMITSVIPFGTSYIHAKMHGNLELPPVPSILAVRPSFPAEVDAVIEKALQRDPHLRQQSAQQLFDEYYAAVRKTLRDTIKINGTSSVESQIDSSDEDRVNATWRETNTRSDTSVIYNASVKRKRVIVGGFLILVLFLLSGVAISELTSSPTQNVEVKQPITATPSPSIELTRLPSNENDRPIPKASPKSSESPSLAEVAVKLAPMYYVGSSKMHSVGMPVTIFTRTGQTTRTVGNAWYLRFQNVPCGETIKIVVSNASYNEGLFPPINLTRYVPCDKPVLDLGEIQLRQ